MCVSKKNVLPVLLFMFLSMNLFSQSKNFEAGKSLNIQYSILRALEKNYVDSVQTQKLVETGINSMLRTLDPYTVFIPEANEEEIDLMTTGSYGGIGSIIRKHESGRVLIVEPHEGSPSHKAGLEPGDMIIEIDGNSTIDMDVEDVSSMLKGQAQTDVNLKIIKVRSGNEEQVRIQRDRVHIPDVIYSGMFQDSIGYVYIGGFTMNGSKDVRKAVESLRSTGKMKKLILDLRSNGGGLMPEAVNLLSLFIPTGTKVVSAKGREYGPTEEYYTSGEPIDLTTPIMVLVNSGSASSSEIVAGAMQDLDRAVIAGVRTLGKGLVQQIVDVGYNSSLKLTVAKYYTPSGRCVQAIDYSNRGSDGRVSEIPDSLKNEFKTNSGRIVYDGGGIEPDIKVEADLYNRPLVALVYSNIISDFSIDYYKKNINIPPPSEFILSDKDYDVFVDYAASQDFDSRTEAEIEMQKVLSAIERDGIFDNLTDEVNALKEKVSLDKKDFLIKHKDVIKPFIEREIVLKYYHRKGFTEASLRTDTQLFDAIDRWDTIDLSNSK